MRLLAGKPGWTVKADVIVIGSGVAGLTSALNLRAHNLSVLLVTKARIDEGSTKWAQGGIAAVLDAGDTFVDHIRDTMVAGAGLNRRETVEFVIERAPKAIHRLVERQLAGRYQSQDDLRRKRLRQRGEIVGRGDGRRPVRPRRAPGPGRDDPSIADHSD